MSIEALLERVAVAIEANTASVEKLTAGREAALAQFEKVAASGETAPKPRGRKKAEETAAAQTVTGDGTGETLPPASQEERTAPAAAATAPTATDDEVRAAAVAYIGAAGDNSEEKQARAGKLKTISDHFGTTSLAGPNGIQDPEQRGQAVYYIKRFAAGLEVNYSQDYDFTVEPTTDAAVGDTGGDEFDIG